MVENKPDMLINICLWSQLLRKMRQKDRLSQDQCVIPCLKKSFNIITKFRDDKHNS